MITWFPNITKRKYHCNGCELVGVNFNPPQLKLIRHVQKLTGLNKQRTVLYLVELAFVLMVKEKGQSKDQVSENIFEKIENKYKQMMEQEKPLTLENIPEDVQFSSKTKRIIVNELRRHPCGYLFEYLDEKEEEQK